MALTESTMMMELGTAAPDFSLPDTVSGKTFTLDSFAGKQGLLVMFICRHCPYVQHVQSELARIGKDYAGQSLGMVAISSNDVTTHPDDRPERLKEVAQQAGYNFPFLYDETQEVAQEYTAACTPDFFLFDAKGNLAYRGQLDDSRPDSGIPVTGKDLRAAIDAVLAGKPAASKQKPSLGCNIKWKAGNEPAY
jgi:peroxiredoxin